MNKFITLTSLLSICLLSSCATIKGFRQHPDTWGKKGKAKKVAKKAELPKQRTVNRIRPNGSTPSANSNNVKMTSNKGRTIEGMIEPDVTKLPDNKELQESNNIVPAPSTLTPKLEAPVAPLLIDPKDPLPSNP